MSGSVAATRTPLPFTTLAGTRNEGGVFAPMSRAMNAISSRAPSTPDPVPVNVFASAYTTTFTGFVVFAGLPYTVLSSTTFRWSTCTGTCTQRLAHRNATTSPIFAPESAGTCAPVNTIASAARACAIGSGAAAAGATPEPIPASDGSTAAAATIAPIPSRLRVRTALLPANRRAPSLRTPS